ncbi:MAG: acyltransferase [Anaerolineae bacterium]|nr:acyltransferase [Anaerolineae bacterium]
MTLQEAFNPQKNSMDFLRFVLAFAVIIVHGYWLGGFGPDPLYYFSHGQIDPGPLAVSGFFILSGFLITRSRQRRGSIWVYLWQRVRRIMPGYWVTLLVTVILFAPIIYLLTNHTLTGYWEQSPFGPFDYLKNNFFLKVGQDRIGELFSTHPTHPYLINGSLWTLYAEFKCYVLVGVLGLVNATRDRRWIALLLTAVVMGTYIIEQLTGGYLRSVFPYMLEQGFHENLAYFLIGSVAYLYADRIPMRRSLFVVSLALMILSAYVAYYRVVALFTYPYMLLWLAFHLPITKWAKYGDFSYGMYLYAFPIQRILAQLGVNKLGVWGYILVAAGVTAVFAVLSYHLVESRFLKRRSPAASPAQLVPAAVETAVK